MKRLVPNTVLLASAGSGKTFQLAHRYLRLVASGVQPGRIVALTFSRKAAGEIFDSMFRYLQGALLSKEKTMEFGKLVGQADLSSEKVVELLRLLVEQLHRLRVGTLDSFCVSVVRAFPLELGIPIQMRLMDNDGANAEQVRQRVLDEMLARHHVDAETTNEFLEMFRQATFGREEKGLERNLDVFVRAHQQAYRLLPQQEAWGDESAIWPDGSEWLEEVREIRLVAERLLASLSKSELSDGQMGRWNVFIEAVLRFEPGTPWSDELNYLFEKIAADLEGFREGSSLIVVDRKSQQLTKEQCRDVFILFRHVLYKELTASLESTRGLYRLLKRYERLYEDMMVREGSLTFEDVLYLLSEFQREHSLFSGGEQQLLVGYRLDGRWDHWLLDEFQDTSDLQWAVIQPIVDEILQDVSGERSFFCVGDAKQSIYRWRGANPHLFENLIRHYGKVLEREPLDVSFRSCQVIIDAVNQVFAKLPDSVPARVVSRWGEIWSEHRVESNKVPQEGYVAFLEAGEEDEDRWVAVADIINKVEPLARGLSVAVLVRKNQVVSEVANFLRVRCGGMPVVQEGRAALLDNPVVSLLLSLIKFAVHPADTWAWRHLEMSPLRTCFERDRLPLQVLAQIQRDGFAAFVRSWGRRLEKECPLDDFGRKRLRELIHAACEFDESNGDADCDAFLHFVERYERKEVALENAIRVMTIHQAKGLGFDLVIVPDLRADSMDKAGALDLMLARDDQAEQPTWVLKAPRRGVAEMDSVLAEELDKAGEENCFDELCLLYVALTRAKRGLYLVVNPAPKKSEALTPARLLRSQLATKTGPVLFETGHVDWFDKIPKRLDRKVREVVAWPDRYVEQASVRKLLRPVLPSMQVMHEQVLSDFLGGRRQENLDLGVALHELFEKVSWLDELSVEDLIRNWEQTSSWPPEVKKEAAVLFRETLASVEVRKLLSKPTGAVELWRERSFEIVFEKEWITGTFDRVVIVRHGDDIRATIVDYKSSEVATEPALLDEVARYRPQMGIYARALSGLLGSKTVDIEIALVFIKTAKVVRCVLD